MRAVRVSQHVIWDDDNQTRGYCTRLINASGTNGEDRRLGEFGPMCRWTDDDTLMYAITERSAEEACRIRTSRLSIALTSAIFLGSYLSRQFIGNEGEEGEDARSLASSHG